MPPEIKYQLEPLTFDEAAFLAGVIAGVVSNARSVGQELDPNLLGLEEKTEKLFELLKDDT